MGIVLGGLLREWAFRRAAIPDYAGKADSLSRGSSSFTGPPLSRGTA